MKNPVFIFGAGNYGKYALRLLDSLNVNICCFLDNGAKEDQTFAGYKVICPKDAVIDKDAIVIIANKNHKDIIKEQLFDMGISEENVVEYKFY